jgi:hypothetical protein
MNSHFQSWGDDLDVDRRLLGLERPVGIEPVGTAPQEHGDGHDDESRDQPGERVDPDRI